MGKKAKFKMLRKIALEMPTVETQAVKGEAISGKELIKKGIDQINITPVLPDNTYTEKTVVAVPVNHLRKMKKLYSQQGRKGVNAYIDNVNTLIGKMNAQ